MKKNVLISVLCVFAAVAGIQAQVPNPYVVISTLDNSIYGNQNRWNSTSNGLGDFLIAGQVRLPGNIRRALIKFDLSKCFTQLDPLNVDSVTFVLTTDSAGHHILAADHEFFLYAAPESWGEGCSDGMSGIGYTAEPGDATWYSRYVRSTYPADTTLTIPWTITGAIRPGRNFLASTFSPDSIVSYTQMTWRSDTLTGTVKSWIQNPCLNNGFVLVGPEAPEDTLTAISFYSKDACIDDGYKPTLNIYYNGGKKTVSVSESLPTGSDYPATAPARKEEPLAVVTQKESEN
jgi:hypothetical protein